MEAKGKSLTTAVMLKDQDGASNIGHEPEKRNGAEVLIRTLKAGDATNFPTKGDTCRVHYEGFLESGQKFDSSRGRQQVFLFRLGMEQG